MEQLSKLLRKQIKLWWYVQGRRGRKRIEAWGEYDAVAEERNALEKRLHDAAPAMFDILASIQINLYYDKDELKRLLEKVRGEAAAP